MRRAAALLGLASILCLAGPAWAGEASPVTLEVPRAPASNEAVWLQVEIGALPPGARVVVRDGRDRILGTVAPFGAAAAAAGGGYLIPLAESALPDGRIDVQVAIRPDDGPERPARAEELRDLRLILVPITR